MRNPLGIVALALLLSSCTTSGPAEPTSPAPQAAVSPVEIPEPLVSEEQDRAACLAAWEAELKTVEDGGIDDATLRATGTACPSLAVWKEMRDVVGYGSKSPNLVTAICALEEDARICDNN